MTYTQLKYNVNAPKPHEFIGSKVRGMLGYALKEEVCINPSYECEGCFAAKECLFYQMFMQENEVHDYRLDFRLDAKEYKFALLLFGSLQVHKSIIDKAMQKALKPHKVKHKEKTKEIKPKKKHKLLKVTLQTPLRLKRQGRLLVESVTLQEILDSIERRYRAMHGLPRPVADQQKRHNTLKRSFYYKKLKRRSGRQHKTIEIGGLMGEIIVENLTRREYELLKIGEAIGVGKSTVFGLGKIKVEELG